MNIIEFHKDKILINFWNLKSKKIEMIDINEIDTNIAEYMQYIVKFNNITFNDFFNTIVKYEDTLKIIYPYIIKDSLKNINTETRIIDKLLYPINTVEFYWISVVHESELILETSLQGWIDSDKYMPYDLSFINIGLVKDSILKINNMVEIVDGKNIVLLCEKNFTLYEILEKFLDQIFTMNDLSTKVNDNNFDDFDIENLIPIKEFILDELKDDLKRNINNENYEKADKIKKEIEKILLFFEKKGI